MSWSLTMTTFVQFINCYQWHPCHICIWISLSVVVEISNLIIRSHKFCGYPQEICLRTYTCEPVGLTIFLHFYAPICLNFFADILQRIYKHAANCLFLLSRNFCIGPHFEVSFVLLPLYLCHRIFFWFDESHTHLCSCCLYPVLRIVSQNLVQWLGN